MRQLSIEIHCSDKARLNKGHGDRNIVFALSMRQLLDKRNYGSAHRIVSVDKP